MNRVPTYEILNLFFGASNDVPYSKKLGMVAEDIKSKYGIDRDDSMDEIDSIISNNLTLRERMSDSEIELIEGYTHSEWEEPPCVFCDICNKDPHNQIIKRYRKTDLGGHTDVIMIEPLNPCKEGHLLFIPDIHIPNITNDKHRGLTTPRIVSDVMMAVGIYMGENELEGNIIINNGEKADKTVFHLHVHFIPRDGRDDGTAMPWSNK